MIIVDVETTGTNPIKNSLVSIGAVDFNNPDIRFYEECRMWNGAHIEPAALAVNGFSEDQIRDVNKPEEKEIITRFIQWVNERDSQVVVGQNPMFDLGFLQNAALRAGIANPLAHRSIDIHSLAFMHMAKRGVALPLKNKKSDLNSDGIMAYVGIPPEPKPHVALNGALWEAEAFARLTYNRSLLSQFSQYPLPW